MEKIALFIFGMVAGMCLLKGFQSNAPIVEPIIADSVIRYDAKVMYIVTKDTCMMASYVYVKCVEGVKPWKR